MLISSIPKELILVLRLFSHYCFIHHSLIFYCCICKTRRLFVCVNIQGQFTKELLSAQSVQESPLRQRLFCTNAPDFWFLSVRSVSLSDGRLCSRLTQGDTWQWEDPEAGTVTENKPASRHFYPIALLLVSSHLLVVWLILSLVFLLAKYQ